MVNPSEVTVAADTPEPQPAAEFARGILIAFFLALAALGAVQVIVGAQNLGQIGIGIGYLAVLIGIQLVVFGGSPALPDVGPSGRFALPLALLAQAVVVYLPQIQFGQWWVGLPGILAGNLLLALPELVAGPAFAAVVASIGWLAVEFGWEPAAIVFHVVTTAFTGITVYGLSRLSRLVRELLEARGELANMAVAEQRWTFARELHDLLGARLSAIMSRSERAARLLSGRAVDAQRQVEAMLTVTRDALAEVRTVARGYRQMPLSGELASAEAVLRSAGVEVRVDRDDTGVPEWVGTALAAVLREGVTNLLRHSEARWCEITVHAASDQVRLDIVNDGAHAELGDGGGIDSLAGRLAAVGGEVGSGGERGGTFRLWAIISLGGPDGRGRDTGDAVNEVLPRKQLPQLSRALANGVLVAVLCGFGAIAFAEIVSALPGAVPLVSSLGYLVALVALQLGHFGRPAARLRSVIGIAALVVQAGLVFLPILQFGPLWLGLPGFFAGNLLLVWRPAIALPCFGAIVASVGALRMVFGGDPLVGLSSALSAAITGLVVYGLTRLARLVGELHRARDELARMAVAEERLRFARDVHDLLGLSLSAIALKAELANRLIAVQPERAAEQLTEIIELCRKALGDVRSVAGGYQELSLEEELASAKSVLASADVDVHIEWDDGSLPESVQGALATVVREGVTNVLRHSKAERCSVTLRRQADAVSLEIRNDGVPPGRRSPEQEVEHGDGIGNLTHRLRAVDGELSGHVDADLTYVLRADVPLPAATTTSRRPSRS